MSSDTSSNLRRFVKQQDLDTINSVVVRNIKNAGSRYPSNQGDPGLQGHNEGRSQEPDTTAGKANTTWPQVRPNKKIPVLRVTRLYLKEYVH